MKKIILGLVLGSVVVMANSYLPKHSHNNQIKKTFKEKFMNVCLDEFAYGVEKPYSVCNCTANAVISIWGSNPSLFKKLNEGTFSVREEQAVIDLINVSIDNCAAVQGN
jgi:hypothetical protein